MFGCFQREGGCCDTNQMDGYVASPMSTGLGYRNRESDSSPEPSKIPTTASSKDQYAIINPKSFFPAARDSQPVVESSHGGWPIGFESAISGNAFNFESSLNFRLLLLWAIKLSFSSFWCLTIKTKLI